MQSAEVLVKLPEGATLRPLGSRPLCSLSQNISNLRYLFIESSSAQHGSVESKYYRDHCWAEVLSTNLYATCPWEMLTALLSAYALARSQYIFPYCVRCHGMSPQLSMMLPLPCNTLTVHAHTHRYILHPHRMHITVVSQ